ncbi:MAG: sulfite exporter TauE/SafE family protein [Halobacteriovoraceae bacterium]|nr:sulfite exporter TauE/SafE family protein [Halobacteriovoraceae bacterium]
MSTGILTGFLSSFFGVGGGVLAVPALYWIFPRLPVAVVIGSSLGMVFFNALINLYNYYKVDNIPSLKLSSFMGAMMASGIIVSSVFVNYMDARMVKLILAVMLLGACIKNMVFFNIKKNKVREFIPEKVSLVSTGMIALSAGMVSGITGLGGGIVIIPMLMHISHFPMAKIPVYCNFCMAVGSFAGVISYMLLPVNESFDIPGVLRYFQAGNVNWGISLILGMGALISSKWGISLHRKISAVAVKIIFIVFLMLVSAKIFMDVL